MEKLFDTTNFPYLNDEVTESYIGYGKTTDLSKMTNTELKAEYDRTEREIKELEKELETSDGPAWTIKERIENAKWYQDKINSFMESADESVRPKEKSIDEMISGLDRNLQNGVITKEYHDRYVNLLESRRKLYARNERWHKEQEEKKKTESQKAYEKKHPFKTFKKNLSEYKKK